jgi:hypothetical protein
VVFPSSAFEINRRAQHWHGGDDWGDMEEVTPSHDPAEADPERGWKHGRIFRCVSCNEQFRIIESTEPPAGS